MQNQRRAINLIDMTPTNAATLIVNLFFTLFIWFIIFPSIYLIVNDKINLLGIYCRESDKNDELDRKGKLLFIFCNMKYINGVIRLVSGKIDSDFERYVKVFRCNAYLSILLIHSFSVCIRSAVGTNATITFNLTLVMTLATLFVLRILSNPTQQIIPFILHIYQDHEINEAVEMYRERLLSFYHAFICSSMMILLIIYSYNLLIGGVTTYIFNKMNISLGIITYLLGLLITTYLGERLLKRWRFNMDYLSLNSEINISKNL